MAKLRGWLALTLAVTLGGSLLGLEACSLLSPPGNLPAPGKKTLTDVGEVSVGVSLPNQRARANTVVDAIDRVDLSLLGASWGPQRTATIPRSQISSDTAWRTFAGVPAGRAVLFGWVRDAAGHDLASGSSEVLVEAGKTLNATLGMNFNLGGLAVNIRLLLPDGLTDVPGRSGAMQVGAAYVGQTVCQYCHDDIDAAYRATAHWTFLARRDDLGRPLPDLNDPACRSCHVVGEDPLRPGQSLLTSDGAPAAFDFSRSATDRFNAQFVGVQCENCHGPGGNHVSAQTLSDRLESITRVPDYMVTCVPCHDAGFGPNRPKTGATDAVVNRGGGGYAAAHPQSLVYLQVGGYTYGRTVAPSAHQSGLPNGCVDCHMTGDPIEAHDPRLHGRSAAALNQVCVTCHGAKFDGASLKASIDGAEAQMGLSALKGALIAYRSAYCTEVSKPTGTARTFSRLPADIRNLDNVATEWSDSPAIVKSALRPATTPAMAGPITDDRATWSAHQTTFNRAYYNWRLIQDDKSFGLHAPTYARTLLLSSYDALSPELQVASP